MQNRIVQLEGQKAARFRRLVSVFFMAASVFTGMSGPVSAAPEVWFASNSPWNIPIQPSEENAAFGERPLAAYRDTGGSVNFNRDIWSVTVLRANKSTPRFTLSWSGWYIPSVPVPSSIFAVETYLEAHKDTDRGVCIYDVPNAKFYQFWQPAQNPQNPQSITVRAGGVFSETGSGWWDNTTQPWTGSASGRCYCAGLVRPDELSAGVIPHAIAAGWPRGLILSSTVAAATVFPAKTTDGSGTNPETALPMGTRLQLDPSLTDAQLQAMGLKSGDIVVAHAMQKYGVYIVDSANDFAVDFQAALGNNSLYANTTNPWPKAIMAYFHATQPPKPTNVAPLETRALMHAPIATGH